MKITTSILTAVLLCTSTAVYAQNSDSSNGSEAIEAPKEVQDVVVEIYRVAPGKHKAFLEAIASYDEVNRRAGLPPRQLYIHDSGASWDFMLIQPARTPDANRAAYGKAWEDMDLPSGPDFFFEFQSMITEHTDTSASGPTTAAAYLALSKK